VEVDKGEDKDEPAAEGRQNARQSAELSPQSQQIFRRKKEMQLAQGVEDKAVF